MSNWTANDSLTRSFAYIALLGLSAVTATCGASRAAAAQKNPNIAIVRGTVFDSLSRNGLDGAVVQLVAADDYSTLIQSAISDSLGRFELRDVPLGHYSIGFVHPLLDSLGLELPLRDLYVTNGGSLDIDLGLPSAATLRVATCGQSRDSSAAVVIGVVRDHVSAATVAGATVKAEWIELVLGSKGFRQAAQQVKVTTAENGWYSICRLPSAGTIGLTATRGNETTDQIELQIPTDRLIRRDLYLGTAVTSQDLGPGDSARVAASYVHSGKGRVSGTVRAATDHRPLAGVYVGIANGSNTRTNENGEWTLTEAPSGTRMLDIRAVGYYPQRRVIDVVQGAPSVRVELSTLKAVLDTVRITAKRIPPDPEGFARRRRIGGGHFLSPADIARFPAVVTSELFRTIPGVRTTLRDGQKFVELRGTFELWCSPAIFVDGHNMSFMSSADIDDYVTPDRVAGIEVYQGTVVPPQFQVGLKGCGSIVIWTR